MISCHDPSNFKNPDEFLPERWLNDETKTSSRCTEAGVHLVVPFGVGKRQCPGRRFVEMELALITAKVRRKLWHLLLLLAFVTFLVNLTVVFEITVSLTFCCHVLLCFVYSHIDGTRIQHHILW